MYSFTEVADYWDAASPQMSHWREAHHHWKEHGEYHARLVKRFEPESIVEWGVGGGMNPAHIDVRPYYAVDISQASLDEASQYGITPILIDVADVVHTRMALPRVDLFLSTAVFQHLPSKGYARRILDLAYTATKYAVLQVRRGQQATATKYKGSVTTACTWGVAEFATDLEAIGWRVEFMERGHADYIYFGASRA